MNTAYTFKHTDLFLDISSSIEKKYILKIKDLPKDDKPREKLLSLGPASLSSHELLAVVLGTGTKKEDVLQMSARVLKEYGERALSHQSDAEALSRDLDIPLTKAIQVVACAELGRRFFERNFSETAVLRTASDVYNYLADMRNLPKEHLRGIYLNHHHRVVHDEVISIGTINTSIIHPREVFKPALEYGAAAVILAHNHPSGIVEPSEADIAVTKQLVEAGKIVGVHVMDHVIIGKNSFKSIDVDYE